MLKKNQLTPMLIAAVFTMPVVANAALSVEDALSQFNLIVLGDAKSSSHVDGRAFVAGNLTGGDYVQHPLDTPASAYVGLTVLGNASKVNVNGFGTTVGGNLTQSNINSGSGIVQGNASNVNFNGGISAVGGTTSAVNFNGGSYSGAAKTAAISSAMATATSNDFDALFTQASADIAGLGDTGGTVTFSGGRATFNANPTGGIAVFDLTAIDTTVFSKSEFEFILNGATTVIFNSDETIVNISANFLAGTAVSLGDMFLWNFYNATTVNLNNQFGGSIIATEAKLTNKNNIEGSVVVGSLDMQGEIHLQPFTGEIPTTIPEPSSYAMLLAGLVALGAWQNRRRT